jgi:hypothetical protein
MPKSNIGDIFTVSVNSAFKAYPGKSEFRISNLNNKTSIKTIEGVTMPRQYPLID